MDRVEDCISFLIGKAGQQIARRARNRLSEHGVTPAQYAVLKVMWQAEGQSGAEISARLVIDSATMTGLIDRLQASGFLERRADGDDRRVQRLFLTKQGKALHAPLDAAMDELNEEVRSELGSNATRFWTGLRKLGDNKG
jgi:DNA-binding MarR family transcriptional regulator